MGLRDQQSVGCGQLPRYRELSMRLCVLLVVPQLGIEPFVDGLNGAGS